MSISKSESTNYSIVSSVSQTQPDALEIELDLSQFKNYNNLQLKIKFKDFVVLKDPLITQQTDVVSYPTSVKLDLTAQHYDPNDERHLKYINILQSLADNNAKLTELAQELAKEPKFSPVVPGHLLPGTSKTTDQLVFLRKWGVSYWPNYFLPKNDPQRFGCGDV